MLSNEKGKFWSMKGKNSYDQDNESLHDQFSGCGSCFKEDISICGWLKSVTLIKSVCHIQNWAFYENLLILQFIFICKPQGQFIDIIHEREHTA